MSQLFSEQPSLLHVRDTIFFAPKNKKLSDGAVRQAAKKAFFSFQVVHPEWVDSLFDLFFVEKFLLPQIKMALSQQRMMTPLDIAMEWDAQFGFGNEETRTQWINQLKPAAETFITALKQELAA